MYEIEQMAETYQINLWKQQIRIFNKRANAI